MKIAVNTRLLIPGKMEGIGWYAFEILKRMTNSHPEVEFVFLFDREFDDSFIFSENVRGLKLFPPARRPVLYKWWFNRSVPRILKKEKIDLFFSPEGYIPLNSDVPAVNVIHDVAFEHFPEHFAKGEFNFYKKYFPRYAREASEVITVSEFSKNDIISKYGIDPKKISVIHNGVRSGLHDLALRSESDPTERPYFIYVGSIHPRKNVGALLKAFDLFCENNEDHDLLVVGRKMDKSSKSFAICNDMSHKDRVKFLGYQSDEKLRGLLRNAKALTYIPLFEGFGMPVIEAFHSGIPVISSKVSSIPEIAGDAALLVDPNNLEEIALAMEKMNDNVFRNDLVKKGIERAHLFSWDLAAERTWEIIARNCG